MAAAFVGRASAEAGRRVRADAISSFIAIRTAGYRRAHKRTRYADDAADELTGTANDAGHRIALLFDLLASFFTAGLCMLVLFFTACSCDAEPAGAGAQREGGHDGNATALFRSCSWFTLHVFVANRSSEKQRRPLCVPDVPRGSGSRRHTMVEARSRTIR
jgi:hypothetical protein